MTDRQTIRHGVELMAQALAEIAREQPGQSPRIKAQNVLRALGIKWIKEKEEKWRISLETDQRSK